MTAKPSTKKPTMQEQIDEINSKIDNLYAAVGKIATLTGNGNHLAEFNIERWVPSKADMKKKVAE